MTAQVGLSPYAANLIMNGFRGSTFTLPAYYIQLHTAIPGLNGTTGISAGSTTRVPAYFSAASGGALAITGSPPSWVNGGVMGEIIDYWSAWDAITSGHFLESGQMAAPITWNTSDTILLNTLNIPLTPIASS